MSYGDIVSVHPYFISHLYIWMNIFILINFSQLKFIFYIEHIILFFPYNIIKHYPNEKHFHITATEFIEVYINVYIFMQ
jgi:hypothetical protein